MARHPPVPRRQAAACRGDLQEKAEHSNRPLCQSGALNRDRGDKGLPAEATCKIELMVKMCRCAGRGLWCGGSGTMLVN